jgi:hypothetical protein
LIHLEFSSAHSSDVRKYAFSSLAFCFLLRSRRISGRVQQEFDWGGTISQMQHGSFSTSMAQTTMLVSGTSRKCSGQNGLSAGLEPFNLIRQGREI